MEITKLTGQGSREAMQLFSRIAARGVFAAACMKATFVSSLEKSLKGFTAV